MSKRKQGHTLRTLNSVSFEKIVGSGTFGVVFKATDKETHERVALKKIKMEIEANGFPITAIREIKILKALHHENIVGLKEMIVYDRAIDQEITAEVAATAGIVHNDIFMVFEYCDFDLSGLLRSNKVNLTEQHIRSYMYQLLQGVAYMHTNMILHRDIKGANILVTRNNVLKIADWGLARTYEDKQVLTPLVVTQWYRSPELLLGSPRYGPEIDMWSIGCLFGEMRALPHAPLLPGRDDAHQLELIFALLGFPQGDTKALFAGLPHWPRLVDGRDKDSKDSNGSNGNRDSGSGSRDNGPASLASLASLQAMTSTVQRRFGHYLDKPTLALLGRLLEMDPRRRATARECLDCDYLWTSGELPRPEQLPRFTVESAFALSEDERMREEHRKKREEAREREEARTRERGGGGDLGEASGGRGLGGRGRGAPGRFAGGRVRVMAPSKYSVSKPQKPAAASDASSSSDNNNGGSESNVNNEKSNNNENAQTGGVLAAEGSASEVHSNALDNMEVSAGNSDN